MAKSSAVNTLNYIRQNSSKAYQEVVPRATASNIKEIGNILLNDAYQPMLNEFVNNLINRIALTRIENKSFSNPLSMFKKGSVPYGTDIQLIYENPAIAEKYEYSDAAMAKLLTITDPDTKAAYLRRNRQDLYTKTIAREGLQGAFDSPEAFDDYVSSITQSLYSGNYIDEFKYTKDLIDGAYEEGKVITEVVSAVSDKATAEALVEKCRALYLKMQFPSTEYNAYSRFSDSTDETLITTWTDAERICVITTADVMAKVDVQSLAAAFNMEKANFMGRVVIVDKFENEEIQAIICDESFIQIFDNIFRFDEFYNARTMSWNEYLHAWGTWAISPFANAVCLATKLPDTDTDTDTEAK
ncbi:MAG: hypothetical protein J6T10_28155 [Methanobrevibacter sp.]|nr:hypothetical protein [Methanobrevibacter sp.]